jgi:hypothetical protein
VSESPESAPWGARSFGDTALAMPVTWAWGVSGDRGVVPGSGSAPGRWQNACSLLWAWWLCEPSGLRARSVEPCCHHAGLAHEAQDPVTVPGAGSSWRLLCVAVLPGLSLLRCAAALAQEDCALSLGWLRQARGSAAPVAPIARSGYDRSGRSRHVTPRETPALS